MKTKRNTTIASKVSSEAYNKLKQVANIHATTVSSLVATVLTHIDFDEFFKKQEERYKWANNSVSMTAN